MQVFRPTSLCLTLCAILMGVAQATQTTVSPTMNVDRTAQVRQQLQQSTDLANRQNTQQITQSTQAPVPHLPPQGVYVPLPEAIYIFVQRQDWERVAELLPRYEQSHNPDQNLILYAKAKLAWSRGQTSQSIALLQRLVEANPDFILGRLELARALFLDHQNKASLRHFATVKQHLNPTIPKERGLYNTIETFEQALHQRDQWQGSLSLGYTYQTNANQSSNYKKCTRLLNPVTQVLLTNCTQTPPPIRTAGLHYEGNVTRRWSLQGHHGLSVNVLAFGDVYARDRADSQHTLSADADYSYQSRQHDVSAGVSVQRIWLAQKPHHDSYGGIVNWQYQSTPQTAWTFNGSVLYQNYQATQQTQRNGWQSSLGVWWWHGVTPQLAFSAGWSTTYQNARIKSYAYLESRFNLGVYRTLAQRLNMSLQGTLTRRWYRQYDAVLGHKRADTSIVLSAKLKAPTWQVWGFVPTLNLKYQRNLSNVDWLYSYHSGSVGLGLERRF